MGFHHIKGMGRTPVYSLAETPGVGEEGDSEEECDGALAAIHERQTYKALTRRLSQCRNSEMLASPLDLLYIYRTRQYI